MTFSFNDQNYAVRPAVLEDTDRLLQLEQESFGSDRLSRRSFRRWIRAEHAVLLVAEHDGELVAYGLVWCHKGTRLARLYSLAVAGAQRGRGLAARLLGWLEEAASARGRLFMRLEVAKTNLPAIRLYESCGYHVFGEYYDYYEDHGDALRMQKTIRASKPAIVQRITPWYQQTTEFTCGPASLMMAMTSLDAERAMRQELELDIWREATTIFMTSGHGGCHPLGLGLAAHKRGFEVQVVINTDQPLFLDGVRSAHKKAVMEVVHSHFVTRAREQGVEVNYADVTQQQVQTWLDEGFAVLMLISTYRLDGKKTPHWVTVTGIDESCLYVHDPDTDGHNQRAVDCQYIPIAREDFGPMSAFGSSRLRTAVAIRLPRPKAA